jgi:hypothetical protein
VSQADSNSGTGSSDILRWDVGAAAEATVAPETPDIATCDGKVCRRGATGAME